MNKVPSNSCLAQCLSIFFSLFMSFARCWNEFSNNSSQQKQGVQISIMYMLPSSFSTVLPMGFSVIPTDLTIYFCISALNFLSEASVKK